jgi:formylmethanofuran dehydrogenase subunit C
MRIELELLPTGDMSVDLGTFQPSRVLSLAPKEIEKLTVHLAGRPYPLGEHFKLRRSASGADELVYLGQTARIVSAGQRMNSGRLVIIGNAGPLTGEGMSGGELEVFGNAGDCLGLAMEGGVLKVQGSAGDWCGAAQLGQVNGMTGGTIIVGGNVGAECGAGMRRGLLVIGGDSGGYAGARMAAGTIFCLGQLGPGAGLEMKRGSLVAGRSAALMPGFRPAGEADAEWLRIYLTSFRRFGLTYPQSWDSQPPNRHTGDHLVAGKGEVLVYDILE